MSGLSQIENEMRKVCDAFFQTIEDDEPEIKVIDDNTVRVSYTPAQLQRFAKKHLFDRPILYVDD